MPLSRRALLGGLSALPLVPRVAWAGVDIHVISSGAFTAAYRALGPRFEQRSGHRLVSAFGASMGQASDAIPQRLARGETADVILLAADAFEEMVRRGFGVPGSRVDLAESRIAIAVRAGAPKPDIGSVDALRRALLEARSIAYSASASGVYYETELVQRLGIADQVLPRSRRIYSERVAAVVARGEAELGIQQLSEHLPVAGIEVVGFLPDEVQRVTVFSAGLIRTAPQPAAARELIAFLASAEVAEVVAATGLDPMSRRR
ncbi:MAG: substrate-binding domain-containing protein [Acetobacteraceae bacterium]|nr:substrate-binding domain-containing protein [Acetobacteraceae bacterium]